jgi:putative transposase
MQKEIERFLIENTPLIKKRGWVFKLIWKTFRYFKVDDVSIIWEVYNSLKSIKINLNPEKEKVKPYWNSQCEKIEPKIWLPKISENYINYKEKYSFWKTEFLPNSKNNKKLFTKVEKENLKPSEIKIVSKKIRFFPENEEKYFQALILYRRAYNLAVSHYQNETFKDENGKWRNLRPEIKAQCKTEQEEKEAVYNSIIVDNAVLSAQKTFKAIISRNKKKKGDKSGFSKIRFKSRKGEIHSFSIDRMPKGLNPVVRQLGKIHLTEEVPEEAIDKSTTITYNKGRWFINVQQHIKTESEIQGDVKVVAIDQGVRTFATCYSESEVIIAGDKFAQRKLYPLMKKVDKLISQKVKLQNLKLSEEPQWYRDRMRYLDKKINKLKSKKDDLISDLHNRLSFELITKYDVIFLPTFETKKMVSKKGERKIRRITARNMLDLNHYKFKLKIKWYADKYGKHVVDVNESYTSKTKSWNGEIDNKLGSKKIIKGDNFSVDRDINGARGIFLKNLTRGA